MNGTRRTLVMAAGGLMAGLMDAQAGETPSLAALTAAGLDPLTVYRQMFASTADRATCCWWYFGTMARDIPDVGRVATAQVETLMVYRTEAIDADGFHMPWREVGVFRDIASGAPATQWFDPVTATTEPRRPAFEDGPGRYTIRRSGQGLALALDQAHATIHGVAVGAAIAGDRLCLTQTEDKARALVSTAPATVRTTLKIYASLAAIRSGAADVAAAGFYSVKARDSGALFVSGLMQKAAPDAKISPVGWERMKAAYPDFFRDDRVAPRWDA
jgi:hypothetical protein